MAVKEFNMNKIKRTFWPFTLKDKKDENGNVVEKGKKIIVRMPQKGVFEAIKDVEANGTGEDADTSTICLIRFSFFERCAIFTASAIYKCFPTVNASKNHSIIIVNIANREA